MKHKVSREIGVALDLAVKEFSLENAKEVPLRLGDWREEFRPLLALTFGQFAEYVVEGYEYPKTQEEAVTTLIEWLADFENHTPPITKNSSYRKGRRHVLTGVREKMKDLGLSEKLIAEVK